MNDSQCQIGMFMAYTDLRKVRCSEPHRAYLVTTVTEGREPWFGDLDNARILISVMRDLHDARALKSLSWVVMPDHLHWLFQLGEASNLALVVNQLKGRSGFLLNRRMQRQGAFWQKSFHDRGLRDNDDVRAIARYIVANPLRAGLVERIGDYPHWDAAWL